MKGMRIAIVKVECKVERRLTDNEEIMPETEMKQIVKILYRM